MTDIPIIAIDGPSGVGKGTLGQALVQKLGFHFLDSGAIYRALAWGVLHEGVDPGDVAAVVALARRLPVRFDAGRVLYGEHDITQAIRTEEVAAIASRVAAIPEVREALLQRQRDFAQPPGLIADGRDMGTVVFPNATVKLFLDAAPEIRAERRYKQLKEQGIDANIVKIIEEIRARDARDRNRPVAPLRPAGDAIVIDTGSMTVDEVIHTACEIIRSKGISCDD
ncbi:cytidylate kinase [Sulfurivirga caldicuralii]|uniref:Cytidylate kinase n=1 Tax=Sulfurivirga caldicuralii TaxID=364032 RepID=A0A1N6FC78_9GAMM|nr:(d)CMP kinase [Sulfurivirga caldicuralii]SIN92852.1 cytidylate kinase [Sulfurivirga caldicuralii]